MKKMIGALCCVLLSLSLFADIKVSDVKVFSGYPWHEVAIGYTITGTADETFGLQISATDNVSGNSYECKTLDGVSLTEGNHIVKWNASADGAKFKSSSVVFTVKVGKLQYCVVDLSGGTMATSYPVTELIDVPCGGWTDEYKTTKLVLRRIEAGSFIMGDDQANEVHRVTLTCPFYMGVFEVTQKQWSLVMGTVPWSSTRYGKGEDYPAHYISYDMIRGNVKGALWPISSEVDLDSFMGKLQLKTGLVFDLPTAAQWEYACRAGSTTTYYWGNVIHGDFAWYSSNSNGKAHPVGTKTPNAWGLYDMSGNMWERCRDWAGSLVYGMDPQGVYFDVGREDRGGSFDNPEGSLVSSLRHSQSPEVPDDDFGFRVSRTLVANCSVVFNATGGAVGMASRVINCGTPLGVLETPVREGFEFLGWYTAETGGTRFDESAIVRGDLTLYARWVPIDETELYCVVDLSGGDKRD